MVESSKEAFSRSVHVEQQIYDNFTSDEDWLIANLFHTSPWEDKCGILNTLTDTRLSVMGRRVIYDNFPELLDAKIKESLKRELADRHLGKGDAPPCRTISLALDEVNQLLRESDESKKEHLESIRDYLNSRMEDCLK